MSFNSSRDEVDDFFSVVTDEYDGTATIAEEASTNRSTMVTESKCKEQHGQHFEYAESASENIDEESLMCVHRGLIGKLHDVKIMTNIVIGRLSCIGGAALIIVGVVLLLSMDRTIVKNRTFSTEVMGYSTNLPAIPTFELVSTPPSLEPSASSNPSFVPTTIISSNMPSIAPTMHESSLPSASPSAMPSFETQKKIVIG